MYLSGLLLVCVVVVLLWWVSRSKQAAVQTVVANAAQILQPVEETIILFWIEASRWKRQLESAGITPHTDQILAATARSAAQRFFQLKQSKRYLPEFKSVADVVKQLFDEQIDDHAEKLVKSVSFEQPTIEKVRPPIGRIIAGLQGRGAERLAAVADLPYEPTSLAPLVEVLQPINLEGCCKEMGDCEFVSEALGKIRGIVAGRLPQEILEGDRTRIRATYLNSIERLISADNFSLFVAAANGVDALGQGLVEVMPDLTRIASLPSAKPDNVVLLIVNVMLAAEYVKGMDTSRFLEVLARSPVDRIRRSAELAAAGLSPIT